MESLLLVLKPSNTKLNHPTLNQYAWGERHKIMAKKPKQISRRASLSKLGFTDIKQGVAIARKLQEKILKMLDGTEESTITPAQIDATVRYLKENNLSLSDLMTERNKQQVQDGEGLDDDDDDDDEKPRGKKRSNKDDNDNPSLCLPFMMCPETGLSIQNPKFVDRNSQQQQPIRLVKTTGKPDMSEDLM